MWLWRISNEHIDQCRSGAKLTPEQAEMLERRARLNGGGLNERLQLLGYTVAKQMRASQHVLWVIEHYPSLPLYAYWGVGGEVASAAKEMWNRHLSTTADPQIYANAAWSLIWHFEDWGQDCYAKSDLLREHEADWWYAKAALFELLADAAQDVESRQRHSGTLLAALLSAFAVERDPGGQMKLLFPARRAALAAASEMQHRLLVLADTAAVRAARRSGGLDDDAATWHLVRGFIALARGRRDEAAIELNAARARGGDETGIGLLSAEVGHLAPEL